MSVISPDGNEVVQTGIVRNIDELGRIVIPIEIRKRFGLAVKDPVEISVKGDVIMLSKPHTTCVFCGAADGLREHRGRPVCRSCVDELAAAGADARALAGHTT